MKVGIMSMQRVINYGSYLQAYGLKQMIEELGGEVVFVDYHIGKCITDMIAKQSLMLKLKIAFAKTKVGKYIRNYILGKNRAGQNSSLEIHFLPVYEALGVYRQKNYLPKLDLLVIGSDEVFNCLQANPNVGYSLELFGKGHRAKKLISYAASFGNTTFNRLRQYGVEHEISHYLKRFDDISVRDNNSGNIIKHLTDKQPLYHLDPVLVGKFDSISKDTVDLKDYIIIYGYTNRFSSEEGEKIISHANTKGKKLISMCGKQDFCDEHIDCSPHEILAYFQHADEIITDTFHGSIFSIITHRPFVTIIRDSIGGEYGNREKLEDMLVRMQMQNRIIENIDDLSSIMQASIDFEAADKIRTQEREKSLAYLRNYVHKGD